MGRKINWDVPHMAQYRTFNGRRFWVTARVKTKREANEQKRLWQNMNRNVRVVPVKGGYDIYISDIRGRK